MTREQSTGSWGEVAAAVWARALADTCEVCGISGALCNGMRGRYLGKRLSSMHWERLDAARAALVAEGWQAPDSGASARGGTGASQGQPLKDYQGVEVSPEREAAWAERLRSVQRLRKHDSETGGEKGSYNLPVLREDIRNVLDLVDQLMRSAAFGRAAEPGEVA